jgi:hypothetical protein
MNRILDEINDEMMRHSVMAAKRDKAGVLADDYRSMASLMSETVRRQEETLRYNEEASCALRTALRQVDVSAMAVAVYGSRKRWISASGLDMSRMQMGGDDLRALAEKMLRGPFSQPEFSLDGGGVSMTMQSLPRMRAVSGRCSAPAERGNANDKPPGFPGLKPCQAPKKLIFFIQQFLRLTNEIFSGRGQSQGCRLSVKQPNSHLFLQKPNLFA